MDSGGVVHLLKPDATVSIDGTLVGRDKQQQSGLDGQRDAGRQIALGLTFISADREDGYINLKSVQVDSLVGGRRKGGLLVVRPE